MKIYSKAQQNQMANDIYPVSQINVTAPQTDMVKININKALDKEAEDGSNQRVSVSGINGTNSKTSNLTNTTQRSPLYSHDTLGLPDHAPDLPLQALLPAICLQFPQI